MKDINRLGLNFYNQRTEKSFNELYDVLHNHLKLYLDNYFYMNDDDKKYIIDISIEKIWNKIDTFLPKYSFNTWVTTINKNTAIEVLISNKKKYKREVSYDNENYYFDVDFINLFHSDDLIPDQTDYNQILDDLIDERLSEKEKDFVYKKIKDKLSNQQISKELDVPLHIIKNRYLEITKRLKAKDYKKNKIKLKSKWNDRFN